MRCGSGERVRTSLYSSPPVRVCVVEVRDVANGRRGSLLCSRDVEQGGDELGGFDTTMLGRRHMRWDTRVVVRSSITSCAAAESVR